METILRGFNKQLVQSLIFWNCWALVFSVFLYYFLKSQKKVSPKLHLPVNLPVFMLIVCYIISVISITLIPLPYSEKFKISNVNLVPVINTFSQLFDPEKRANRLLATDVIANITGNILMFIPFGIIIPELFPRTNRYMHIAVAAIFVSATIETLQYFSKYFGNYRQVDIDDVILNTTGALIGYFIYRHIIGPENITLLKEKVS